MFCHPLVLGAALLSCCAGESSVPAAPQTVLAFAGGDVVLPCSFHIRDDFPTVEWSKVGPKPNIIFLYRDGCETYEMKNPAFNYRTSLIPKELKNRNISLRISNVQLSDAGKYQCMTLWNNPNTREITTLELVVGAASEPKLSVVSAETGGVTLQCEANCWQPEPQITFLDDHGNNISAEDPKRERENHSGCYTVRRRVTLQAATNRVTCRVHQPDISQTRETEILIPVDCLRSWTPIICASVGGTVSILSVCGLAAFFIWKRCCKSAEGPKLPVSRKLSDQSTMSYVSQSQLFMKQRDITGNAGNDIEQLRREVADLNSKIRERDEMILKLQNDPKSRLSPVVCQHSQPTILCSPSKSSPDVPKAFNPKPTASTNSNPPNSGILPQNEGAKPGISRENSNPALGHHPRQRKHRTNSSPDIFNYMLSSSSSASTSRKMPGTVSRSNSECCARPHPNNPRPQRRSSAANRFSLLAHLSEETELLVP